MDALPMPAPTPRTTALKRLADVESLALKRELAKRREADRTALLEQTKALGTRTAQTTNTMHAQTSLFKALDRTPPPGYLIEDLRPPAPYDPDAKPQDPNAPRPGRPSNAAEWRNVVITKAFGEERLTLADLTPDRIRCAWRIVREFARIKGAIEREELLSQALGLSPLPDNPDPWAGPLKWTNKPNNPHDPYVALDAAYSQLDPQTQHPQPNFPYPEEGLPLLPPPPPPEADPNTYDTSLDMGLRLYIEAIRLVVQDLGIDGGSPQDADYGRYGLLGMQEHDLIRVVFPSRLEIAAWEEILVEETTHQLVDKGITEARKSLYMRYGLQQREIDDVIAMARGQIRARATAEEDEERGLMILRLEAMALRCRSAMDHRAELAVMKQLAIIQGLSSDTKEEALEDFVNIVAEVAGRRQPRQIVANSAGKALE